MKNYKVKQFLNFKERHEDVDLAYIHPHLLMVIGFVGKFCLERGIRPVLTSVVRTYAQNERYNSSSLTHVQGRAADLSLRSVHGWTYNDVQELIDQLNHLTHSKELNDAPNPFYQIGAISAKDHRQRVIVVHKNYNAPESDNKFAYTHAHLQVRPDSDWDEYLL